MSVTKIARRYALSLLEVADEQKTAEKVLEDCKLISETISASRELQVFLKSPIVKTDKKLTVLNELFFKKIQILTQTFIEIIVRKNRIEILGNIAAEFVQVYKNQAGILDVWVEAASDMNKTEISALKKSLETRTGKKVELTVSENKKLIGGVTVKIDDTVIDGSVKHKLESLADLFQSSTN